MQQWANKDDVKRCENLVLFARVRLNPMSSHHLQREQSRDRLKSAGSSEISLGPLLIGGQWGRDLRSEWHSAGKMAGAVMYLQTMC